MNKSSERPKWFHFKHGAYYYVRNGKWQRLSSDEKTALALYHEIVETPRGKMPSLIDEAIAAMPKLSKNTVSQYRTAARHLKAAFGEFQPHEVLPRHVAEFRADMREIPNMANRCLSLLRGVFAYALERQLIDSNPATGIKRLPEQKRERLLSPAEYWAIHEVAGPRLQIIMDLCYLTGQRINDVLGIRRSQIRDGGIEFRQGKTGKRLHVSAPGLAEVIERAKALHGNVHALTLLRGRNGKPPDYSSVHEQWQIACKAAGVDDARLHDIRAMSLTAAKAQGLNPTALAGHTSEAMTARYLRSKEVPEVSGPIMSKKSSVSNRQ